MLYLLLKYVKPITASGDAGVKQVSWGVLFGVILINYRKENWACSLTFSQHAQKKVWIKQNKIDVK